MGLLAQAVPEHQVGLVAVEAHPEAEQFMVAREL